MTGLRFDVDLSELEALARSLELETPQIQAALSRAVNRTRGTLRADSARGLRSRLGLRTATRLRRRIKVRWIRRDAEIELWYGENDFPVREFSSPPAVASGPGTFRGRPFAGGPVSTWRRLGRARFPVEEVGVPVKEQMDEFLEDVVFPRAGELLLDYFAHEVRARGIFGVGQ